MHAAQRRVGRHRGGLLRGRRRQGVVLLLLLLQYLVGGHEARHPRGVGRRCLARLLTVGPHRREHDALERNGVVREPHKPLRVEAQDVALVEARQHVRADHVHVARVDRHELPRHRQRRRVRAVDEPPVAPVALVLAGQRRHALVHHLWPLREGPAEPLRQVARDAAVQHQVRRDPHLHLVRHVLAAAAVERGEAAAAVVLHHGAGAARAGHARPQPGAAHAAAAGEAAVHARVGRRRLLQHAEVAPPAFHLEHEGQDRDVRQQAGEAEGLHGRQREAGHERRNGRRAAAVRGGAPGAPRRRRPRPAPAGAG
ncbi:hypothetical protein STCU_12302 [Strigomonas culicis]|uniref:Uncharacterized protein n=1 Tax=Strigomonas culicis TaxID=28005 RepID=S9TFR1_9TRYP|nr:hypothetical protein STCU_12302 [Strigomonas culicis]|eukprot:EPY15158.1 hypothetical protein STCU_12302 [Strigomonas culicis]